MDSTTLQIIIGIITFSLGSYLTFLYQKFQSKEAIKQNLYSERLRLFQELNKEIMQATFFVDNSDRQKLQQQSDMISSLIIGNAFLFSSKLFELTFDFINKYQTSPKTDFNNWDVFNAMLAVIEQMGKELGITKLSKEIGKLLESSTLNRK